MVANISCSGFFGLAGRRWGFDFVQRKQLTRKEENIRYSSMGQYFNNSTNNAMKKQSFSTLVAGLLFALVPSSLPAVVQFWDPDGTTVGTSVPGNWDTLTTNWTATTDSGVNTVWTQSNDANFGVAANYTVTLTEPIIVGNVTLTGAAGALAISGTTLNSLTLAASAVFDTGARTLTLSAPINGSFDLTKIGTGTLTLSGASTYSGGTTLSAGTTSVGVDSVSLGGVITSGPLGTGPVTVSAASTMTASGGAHVVDNPVTLNANVTIGGSSALTFRNGNWMVNGASRTATVNNTADTTIGSNLADDGIARTFTKAGTGRLILSGTNSGYLGPITISAGTLMAGGNSAIQANAVLTATGTLNLNGFNGQVVGLSGAGSVTLGSGTLTIANAGSSRNFTGVISGTGGLIISNSVSQQLEGQNTFSGGILIQAGTLFLRTNAVIGSSITKAAGTGTITIDPAPAATSPAAIGGNLATGVVQITNRIVLNSGRALFFASNGGTVEFDGIVSGSGGFLRDNNGSGPVVLTGNNTYSGGLQFESRVLALGHKNALGTGPFVIGNPTTPPANTMVLAAVADLSGVNALTNITTVNQSFTIADATSGASNLELSGPLTLSNAVTISTIGTALVKFSGNIDGPGGLTKAGANTLILSGANTYASSTTVSGGTLVVNNTSGSGTGASSVTVGIGGTLGGNGTVAGPVTVNSGGSIGAGSSAGKLTLLNGLDLSGGGTSIWELAAGKDNSTGTAGTDFDQVAISGGNLNLGVSATLSLGFIGSAAAPSTTNAFWRAAHAWTIVKLSGSAANISGSAFSTISNGSYSVGNFTNSVAGDGSILLTFAPTPAPAISKVARSGNNIDISFVEADGANYRVEYTTSLSPANWQLLQTITGTGGPFTVTDVNPTDPQRYYRIVLTD